MRTECKDTRASHRKKRIGIGGNLMFMEGGIFPGYGKSYVNDDYVQAVASAGGVPMILPVTDEEDIVEAQIEAVDGLVISGGWDVDPLLWGEEPHEKLGSTLPVRDTFDRLLIAAARRRGLPILGICRGLQSLNVVLGGTLYQDMSEVEGSFVRHFQGGHPAQAGHGGAGLHASPPARPVADSQFLPSHGGPPHCTGAARDGPSGRRDGRGTGGHL